MQPENVNHIAMFCFWISVIWQIFLYFQENLKLELRVQQIIAKLSQLNQKSIEVMRLLNWLGKNYNGKKEFVLKA